MAEIEGGIQNSITDCIYGFHAVVSTLEVFQETTLK